jgi:N,N'-diacetyllegionaminate synthase
VPFWKVASGELANDRLLDRLAETGLPVVLSSGMSPLEELDRVVRRMQAREVDLALLQCTTAYPCPPEKVGLNMIPVFRERYGCAVGLSDHSATIYPSLAAAALGADVLEVHVTLSREMFGPDVVASITTAELRQMVEGVRFIERMLASPVDKDALARETAPLRRLFTRSVVARTALPAGAVLTAADLAIKKPGTGMPPARLPEIVGRRLCRDVAADTLLTDDDLDPLPDPRRGGRL